MSNAVPEVFEPYNYEIHDRSIPAQDGYGWRIGDTGLMIRADKPLIDVWQEELTVKVMASRVLQYLAFMQGVPITRNELASDVWQHNPPQNRHVLAKITDARAGMDTALKLSGCDVSVDEVFCTDKRIEKLWINHPRGTQQAIG